MDIGRFGTKSLDYEDERKGEKKVNPLNEESKVGMNAGCSPPVAACAFQLLV